jgi:2-dehydro-3-deoxyphosphooctonate aldolase (KDO 8-P synthase)
MNTIVKIQNIEVANDKPFILFAGPCAMESLEHALDSVKFLKELTDRLNIPFVFKSSFDKANRTSINSSRGVGIDEGVEIFREIKKQFNNIPIVTDVHLPEHCEKLKEVVDVLQIPAFLCRQTDLLVAAAKTGLVVNVKKGQFLSPQEMVNVVEKIKTSGNNNVLACERGTTFGYNTLINDFKGVATMVKSGTPVIFDATHSCQQPGGNGNCSGGQREFAEILARCALSIGIAGVFIETHKNPDKALSDGPNMIPMHDMERVLNILKEFDTLAKKSNKK